MQPAACLKFPRRNQSYSWWKSGPHLFLGKAASNEGYQVACLKSQTDPAALVSKLVPSIAAKTFLAVLSTVGSLYTVIPLSGITVSLLHECKWDRGQLLLNANEIESAFCDAENC
jgi:hypothetical protein